MCGEGPPPLRGRRAPAIYCMEYLSCKKNRPPVERWFGPRVTVMEGFPGRTLLFSSVPEASATGQTGGSGQLDVTISSQINSR